MSIVSNSKHDCLIAGDWNIDLLKYGTDSGTESFVNNLHANLLIPVITRPTRFAEFSSTQIDNILNNKPQNLLVAGAQYVISPNTYQFSLYLKRFKRK